MSPQSRAAIEAAQRVLAAIAEGREPKAAELNKLRSLAPPLANLPPAELATKVMQLVSEISGKDREAETPSPKARSAPAKAADRRGNARCVSTGASRKPSRARVPRVH